MAVLIVSNLCFCNKVPVWPVGSYSFSPRFGINGRLLDPELNKQNLIRVMLIFQKSPTEAWSSRGRHPRRQTIVHRFRPRILFGEERSRLAIRACRPSSLSWLTAKKDKIPLSELIT